MNDGRGHNREGDARGDLPLDALLSAYLDDRESLDAGELERVEALLASDAEVQRAYAEMRVIVGELRGLEPVAAPRSYHLDAEMVGAPEPVSMTATDAWYIRHVSAIRWATAAAAVIFVFVLSADLVINGILRDPTSSSNDTSSLPADQSQLVEERETADDAALEAPAESDAAGPQEAVPESDASASEDAQVFVAPSQKVEEAEDEGESSAGAADEAESGGDADSELPLDVPTAEIAIAEDGSEPLEDEAPGDTARTTAATAVGDDDEAAAPEIFAFDDEAASSDDDGSGRRLWRIAEFSLVMILALLITALIILPRMARAPTRR